MNETITKTYDSKTALENVWEDLVATGMEQEQIFLDKEKLQVKVITPKETEAEIREILGRHKPLD